MAFPSQRLLWAVLFLVPVALCLPQTITVTSGTTDPLWAVGTFGVAQITGGAGTDFTSTQTTAANWVDIDITLGSSNSKWRVDVSKADTTWNANLYIQRTADGTGDAHPLSSITGGTIYQEITSTTSAFFSGQRARTDVKAQLQLQGLSATVGPHNFVTTVTFTLTEL